MNSFLQLLRKLLLVGSGLSFLFFAVLTTVNIDWSAKSYALAPVGIGGDSEFRAVFMGFWLGLAILFFQSVRHYRVAILGDMAFMLTLFQSLGRLYSFVVDGIPPTQFIIYFVAEFSSSVIGLLIRPHGTPLHRVEPSPTTKPSSFWMPNRST
jgi:hypothetical protein